MAFGGIGPSAIGNRHSHHGAQVRADLNVFAALAGQSTYAEEDYLTECFALLIRHLLTNEPEAGP